MAGDPSPASADRPWRRAATQVFVEDLWSPELDDAGDHHLRRVLRLGHGEVVCAADGRGGWRLCRFAPGGLSPEGEVGREERADPPLTVGFAPVKGDRPEWAVQKLTEVGIDRILLLRAARSVVRWEPERADRHVARLLRVAREAAQQCRRLWLPEVSVPATGAPPAGAVLADAGGRPLAQTDNTVLIGPEGGWTTEEHDGLEAVGLAGNILRTETAAVVAGAAMVSLRLGLTRPGLAELSP